MMDSLAVRKDVMSRSSYNIIKEIQAEMDKKSLVLYPISIEDIFNSYLVQHMKTAREFVIRFEDPYAQLHCVNGLLQLKYRTYKECENARKKLQQGIEFLFGGRILVQCMSEFETLEVAMEDMWLKEYGELEPKASRLMHLNHMEVFEEDISDDLLLEKIPSALSVHICDTSTGKRAYIEFLSSKEAKKTMRCLREVLDCDGNQLSTCSKPIDEDQHSEVVTSSETTVDTNQIKQHGNNNKRNITKNNDSELIPVKRTKVNEDTKTGKKVLDNFDSYNFDSYNSVDNTSSELSKDIKAECIKTNNTSHKDNADTVSTNGNVITVNSGNEINNEMTKSKRDSVITEKNNGHSQDISSYKDNKISSNSHPCNNEPVSSSSELLNEISNSQDRNTVSTTQDKSISIMQKEVSNISDQTEVTSTCVSPKINSGKENQNSLTDTSASKFVATYVPLQESVQNCFNHGEDDEVTCEIIVIQPQCCEIETSETEKKDLDTENTYLVEAKSNENPDSITNKFSEANCNDQVKDNAIESNCSDAQTEENKDIDNTHVINCVDPLEVKDEELKSKNWTPNLMKEENKCFTYVDSIKDEDTTHTICADLSKDKDYTGIKSKEPLNDKEEKPNNCDYQLNKEDNEPFDSMMVKDEGKCEDNCSDSCSNNISSKDLIILQNKNNSEHPTDTSTIKDKDCGNQIESKIVKNVSLSNKVKNLQNIGQSQCENRKTISKAPEVVDDIDKNKTLSVDKVNKSIIHTSHFAQENKEMKIMLEGQDFINSDKNQLPQLSINNFVSSECTSVDDSNTHNQVAGINDITKIDHHLNSTKEIVSESYHTTSTTTKGHGSLKSDKAILKNTVELSDKNVIISALGEDMLSVTKPVRTNVAAVNSITDTIANGQNEQVGNEVLHDVSEDIENADVESVPQNEISSLENIKNQTKSTLSNTQLLPNDDGNYNVPNVSLDNISQNDMESSLLQTSKCLAAVSQALEKAKELMSSPEEKMKHVSTPMDTFMSLVLDGSLETTDNNAGMVLKNVFQYAAENNHCKDNTLSKDDVLGFLIEEIKETNLDNSHLQTNDPSTTLCDMNDSASSAFEEFACKETMKMKLQSTYVEDSLSMEVEGNCLNLYSREIDNQAQSRYNPECIITHEGMLNITEKKDELESSENCRSETAITIKQKKEALLPTPTALLPTPNLMIRPGLLVATEVCNKYPKDLGENKFLHKPLEYDIKENFQKQTGPLLQIPNAIHSVYAATEEPYYCTTPAYEAKLSSFYNYEEPKQDVHIANVYSGIQSNIVNQSDKLNNYSSTSSGKHDPESSKSRIIREKYLQRYLERQRKRQDDLRNRYRQERNENEIQEKIRGTVKSSPNRSIGVRSDCQDNISRSHDRRREKSVARALQISYDKNKTSELKCDYNDSRIPYKERSVTRKMRISENLFDRKPYKHRKCDKGDDEFDNRRRSYSPDHYNRKDVDKKSPQLSKLSPCKKRVTSPECHSNKYNDIKVQYKCKDREPTTLKQCLPRKNNSRMMFENVEGSKRVSPLKHNTIGDKILTEIQEVTEKLTVGNNKSVDVPKKVSCVKNPSPENLKNESNNENKLNKTQVQLFSAHFGAPQPKTSPSVCLNSKSQDKSSNKNKIHKKKINYEDHSSIELYGDEVSLFKTKFSKKNIPLKLLPKKTTECLREVKSATVLKQITDATKSKNKEHVVGKSSNKSTNDEKICHRIRKNKTANKSQVKELKQHGITNNKLHNDSDKVGVHEKCRTEKHVTKDGNTDKSTPIKALHKVNVQKSVNVLTGKSLAEVPGSVANKLTTKPKEKKIILCDLNIGDIIHNETDTKTSKKSTSNPKKKKTVNKNTTGKNNSQKVQNKLKSKTEHSVAFLSADAPQSPDDHEVNSDPVYPIMDVIDKADDKDSKADPNTKENNETPASIKDQCDSLLMSIFG